jgi:hypothetical protein
LARPHDAAREIVSGRDFSERRRKFNRTGGMALPHIRSVSKRMLLPE